MKKTLTGTILGILLVWSIYFFYVTRDIMFAAKSSDTNANTGFVTFLFAGAVLITTLIFLIINGLRDKKSNRLADRLLANTTISEQDEREKRIAGEVAKKSYVTLSNFTILFMAVLPMFNLGQTFTVNQVLATIAVVVTVDSMLSFYWYYRLYNK